MPSTGDVKDDAVKEDVNVTKEINKDESKGEEAEVDVSTTNEEDSGKKEKNPSVTEKLTGKRKRSATTKSSNTIDLGEGPVIEILEILADPSIESGDVVLYLEILSKLEADIETLKKTKAGVCLRNLQKQHANDERIKALCKQQISVFKRIVRLEMDRKGQSLKKRKLVK